MSIDFLDEDLDYGICLALNEYYTTRAKDYSPVIPDPGREKIIKKKIKKVWYYIKFVYLYTEQKTENNGKHFEHQNKKTYLRNW